MNKLPKGKKSSNDGEENREMKKDGFKGYNLNVPAYYDWYLSKIYGNNYMDYPKSGLLHHTDSDSGLAQDRAKKHNIDMNKVLEYLVTVYSAI